MRLQHSDESEDVLTSERWKKKRRRRERSMNQDGEFGDRNQLCKSIRFAWGAWPLEGCGHGCTMMRFNIKLTFSPYKIKIKN